MANESVLKIKTDGPLIREGGRLYRRFSGEVDVAKLADIRSQHGKETAKTVLKEAFKAFVDLHVT